LEFNGFWIDFPCCRAVRLSRGSLPTCIRQITLITQRSRLAELAAAIHAATELLSPADAHAIWHELETVGRALKHAPPARQPRRPLRTICSLAPDYCDIRSFARVSAA